MSYGSGQCATCCHLYNETDESVGLYDDDHCATVEQVLTEDGSNQPTVDMFQNILFTLGRLNNCPYYENKQQRKERERREASLKQLREELHADPRLTTNA